MKNQKREKKSVDMAEVAYTLKEVKTGKRKFREV
eukprot:CAMPEP_0170471000 /NCGR_PEP_ID=MMETSP0123-20130129/13312_1 /TAXON_ID=182087 /ORGANISM="Favella ehrenbergii, Strain Fehren 1" /LENGTH=33 /DNA_ID= /DNA_START= /DNA_END= /DNA_ORIENTATION=